MKRGILKRKTRLRPASKQRRAENDKVAAARFAFKAEFPKCMACNLRPTTDCHEIVGGGSRRRTMAQRECWLALCRDCHSRIQGLPQGMKHPVELAIKRLRDPEWYSLEAFRAAKGGGLVVTEEDVDQAWNEVRKGA